MSGRRRPLAVADDGFLGNRLAGCQTKNAMFVVAGMVGKRLRYKDLVARRGNEQLAEAVTQAVAS